MNDMDGKQVVDRYIALYKALRERASFWEDRSHIRYTAMMALGLPGTPVRVAADLARVREEIKNAAGTFSTLNAGATTAFAVSAMLLRSQDSVRAFLDDQKAAHKLFRAHKLPRGQHAEIFAVALLRAQSGNKAVSDAQVQRLATMYRQMKHYHSVLTGPNDYPSLAVLCGGDEGAERTVDRVEQLYQALVEKGAKRRNALQAAACIMYQGKATATQVNRFATLRDAFKAEGVRIYASDYDELALLSLIDQATETTVRRVQAVRGKLKELRPRMDADTHFSIASSLTFMEHVGSDGGLHMMGKMLADSHAMIAAQQAAMVSMVAVGVASSASASAG